MSFLESLRMNGLLDRGRTPFGMPNLDASIPEQPFQMVRAALNDDKHEDWAHQDAMIRQQREYEALDRALANTRNPNADMGSPIGVAGVQGMSQGGTATPGVGMGNTRGNQPNVVLGSATKGGAMTDYQRALINLRGQDQSSDASLAQQKIDLTGQANDKKLDDAKKIELSSKARINEYDSRQQNILDQIAARLSGQEKISTAGNKSRETIADKNNAGALERDSNNGQPFAITDPKDPSKTISVRFNPTSNKLERVTLDGDDVGPLSRPSSKGGPSSTPEHNQFAQDTIDTLDKIIAPDGSKFNDDYASIIGGSRAGSGMGRFIPGSSKWTADDTLTRFKAQNLTALVAKLKENGANPFGILSNADRDILNAAATGDISAWGDEAQILQRMNVIRAKLQKSISKPGTTQSKVSDNTGRPSADDLIAQYSKPRN